MLKHSYQHNRISTISALTVSPRRKCIALYIQFHKVNISSDLVLEFLHDLLYHLRGNVILIWDDSPTHKSRKVKAFLCKYPRVHVERFPGYAPELNPVEFIWTNIKRTLSNSTPKDVKELLKLLRCPTHRLKNSKNLLWSCIYASDLPWKK